MLGFLWDYWPWIVPGLVIIAGLVAFSVVTKNWRWLAPAGAIVVALAALGRAHKQGADYEREQLARRNDAAKRRAEADRKAARAMTDDELDAELRKWGK